MKCPKCDMPLVVSQRQGVEIDICPQCRGVWLDRGEMDKIINRYDAYDADEERFNFEQYQRRRQHAPKRASFWHELFD